MSFITVGHESRILPKSPRSRTDRGEAERIQRTRQDLNHYVERLSSVWAPRVRRL